MAKFVSEKIKMRTSARLAAVQATYMAAYGQLPVDEVIKEFFNGEVVRQNSQCIHMQDNVGREARDVSELHMRRNAAGPEKRGIEIPETGSAVVDVKVVEF